VIALIVCPLLVSIILVAAGLIWFFVKKKLFPGVPDGMYISVNPEYMNTEGGKASAVILHEYVTLQHKSDRKSHY
jgi:hypothetical protein